MVLWDPGGDGKPVYYNYICSTDESDWQNVSTYTNKKVIMIARIISRVSGVWRIGVTFLDEAYICLFDLSWIYHPIETHHSSFRILDQN
ncbi:unnamed protein product [Rhizophagus irregularis]|nr:unnamed protein product [Rhizophagus irregularis]